MEETGCVENDEKTSEQICKTKELCTKAKKEGEEELECKNFPVSFEKRYDHYCELDGKNCVENESKCK